MFVISSCFCRQNNLWNSETHDGRSSILSAETILVDGCSNYASGIKANQTESAGALSSFKNELQHQKILGEKVGLFVFYQIQPICSEVVYC